MKLFLFAGIISIFCFSSCSTEINTPSEVAKNYVENLAHGNIDKAITYTTESSAKLLEFTKKFPIAKDDKYKFTLIKDSISDDKAWITYKTIYGEEDVLTIIKENDKWKVSLGD